MRHHDGPMQHASTVEAVEAVESVVGSIRRRRAPITDDRLREFAEAYHERWIPGRALEFAESLFMSERQMYRLKKLAQERGFLDDEGQN